jgi:hypothetical protein
MSAIVILNIVLAALAVTGILSLLGWAIVTDRRPRGIPRAARRPAPRPQRARQRYSALDVNA